MGPIPPARAPLDRVPPGEDLFIVTHGGIVEGLTVGLAPNAGLHSLGAEAGYAEGVRVVYHEDGTCLVEALRLD